MKCETFIAHFAFEEFIICVDVGVSQKTSISYETSIVHVICEWFITTVDAYVIHKAVTH
jgi:hypothetical protein